MSARGQVVSAMATRDGAQQMLCAQVVEAVQAQFGRNIRALILTGSLARDEGSFLREEDRWRLLGDAEFLLILHDGTTLISDQAFRTTARAIEQRLGEQAISCRIDLSAAYLEYLRRMQPHIFAYELRTCGKVIWGDTEALTAIPAFTVRDIPKADAWWLLCNRMIEQLTWLSELHAGAADADLYGVQKFYLELATSLLVFLDLYEPSYSGRAAKLAELARRGTPELPFPLPAFAAEVVRYTEFKLRPEARLRDEAKSTSLFTAEWLKPIPYARKLWQWEIEQLLGASAVEATPDTLMRRLLRKQKLADKAKGWLYAVRANRQALSPLLRRWTKGTPRYLTYAAASRLYFAMPDVLNGSRDEVRPVLNSIRALLPLLPAREHASGDWVQLCRGVAWNYEQFLTRTRLS